MNSEQIKRLLALPVKWRKRLADQPGPGWWIEGQDEGDLCELVEDPGSEVSETFGALARIDGRLAGGWAWAPCDSLAWMKVAAQGRHYVMSYGRAWIGWPAETEFASALCPIDCALSAMEAMK